MIFVLVALCSLTDFPLKLKDMEILSSDQSIDGNSALTIGVFDGIHVGHQKVLTRLDGLARPQKLKRVVVTFNVHPLTVLATGHAPKMLLSLDRKLELLEQSQLVDAVLVIDFDVKRAEQTAQDFVNEVLVKQLKARQVLVGSNFVFGNMRQGNVSMLKEMGVHNDFEVSPVELLCNESESPVSSTLIRQYISVGNISKANELLTRPHELSGVVVPGDQVGNELGYPTANTQVDDSMSIPSDGVYSGRATLESGQVLKSAISIGVRPMFHEDNIRVIEPYLLDFNEMIYGQKLTIQFIEKLRDQMVLESVDALIKQIDADVQRVRDSIR